MQVIRNGRWQLIGLLPVLGLALIPSLARAGDLDFSSSRSDGYAGRFVDGAYAGEFGAWTERLGFKQDEEGNGGGNGEPEEFRDDTGTDPRDFRNKFMPYYRYTELKNGLFVHEGVIFGLYAFTPNLAMTYEIPVAKYMDYSEPVKKLGPGVKLPGGPALPGFGGGGFVGDTDEFGIGDSIFRFMFRPESLAWEIPATWGPKKGEQLGGSILPILETTIPTNTDDILGEDAWILSPGFAIVQSTPTMGFIAGMFFYDFSTIKGGDEVYTSRIRSRIFWMQPFSKPGPGLFDGIYMMPEFQPAYDLRTDEFSFWVGPEFGKVILLEGDGKIKSLTFYAKPGWGWDPDATDREWTFETGIRLFF